MADAVKMGGGRTRSTVWRAVALLLLLGAAGVFVQRGLVRGVTGSHDLTMMYAGARQWVFGGNPYPLDAAYDAYLDGGGGAERPRDPKWFAQLYPPTTYAVMAPVGALPWSVARVVFCGLNVLGWAVAGGWVWGWRPQSAERKVKSANQTQAAGSESGAAAVLVGAAFLAWAPVHTTLAFGQLGGVVVGLVCLGVGAPRSGESEKRKVKSANRTQAEPVLRGLALALACCLKPQLAGLFVVALAVAGRWRTVGWTCGWGLVIAAVAVGRLMATAPMWWADLRSNVAAFAGTGFADPSRANPQAWQMINLEPWLRHVGVGEVAAGVLPWVLGVAAFAAVAWSGCVRGRQSEKLAHSSAAMRPQGKSENQTQADGGGRVTRGSVAASPCSGDADAFLRLLAVAAVVSLLVVYHRTYDAVLLVFPAAWAWRAVAARGWVSAGGVAAGLIAVMGLPLPAVLSEAVKRGWLPGTLAEQAWWVPGVLMHQNVVLLALGGLLAICGGPQTPRRPRSAGRNTGARGAGDGFDAGDGEPLAPGSPPARG